jgi:O-antigen ligase
MTSFISLLLFIFLGFFALYLATKTDMENPTYIIFILTMGLFRPSGNLPGGFDLSSMWLLLNIILLLMIYLKNYAGSYGVDMISRIYLIYLIYVTINTIPRLGETTSLEFFLRMLLKQIYPLLVLIVALKIFRVNAYLNMAISKTLMATFIASIFLGGVAKMYLPSIVSTIADFTWPYAAFSDHSAIITSLALIWWAVTQKKKYLFLAIWLCLSTILMANRTGIAATFIGILFFALLRFGIVRALPLVIALYFAGMSVLFLSPDLQNKMFVTDTAVDSRQIIERPTDIDFDTIQSHGRFAIWQTLLDKFWRPHPLTGSGLGTVQNYLYSPQNLTGLNHPHSSYVKVLCDSGLIGLFLFVSIHLSCMLSAYRILTSQSNEYAKIAAGFVFCAVSSLLFIMGFDSGINCATAIMQYSFAFSGIMIGLSRQDNEEPEFE